MKVVSKTLLAFVLGLAATSSLQAISINISPSSDRTAGVSGGVANSLRADDDVYLRTFGMGTVWRSALEFSIAAVPSGSTINSATLRLVDHGTQVAGTIQIHGYSADGIVGLGDFAYNNLLTSYNTVDGSFISHPHYLDVTAFIQGQISGSSLFSGFMLKTSNEGTFTGADIASNEFEGDVNLRPLLTIDYTPAVPDGGSTIAMLGLAMTAFTATRRKFGI